MKEKGLIPLTEKSQNLRQRKERKKEEKKEGRREEGKEEEIGMFSINY